ncbi:phosphoesterase [Catenulispora acidiphila DSM 44928]|uniref:Phosphoesterase n=1 Tax=Catenulispora acidiphila (strain DSM 44928 / JCM 14897 / NBRC 102108 / NRRL B-24433 / ID139908) TaxID=479433 RepID=C7QFU4_CATAD|nr:phosphoesterase [Catenulispora acidiphila]ACU70921.1 phosphoesterase [Catenulispora acidiphila DSM 44928]
MTARLPHRAARRSRTVLLASTATLALAAGVLSVTTARPAHATSATAPAAVTAKAAATSGNLLVDAGAESAAQCSSNGLDAMTMPGWTIVTGDPNAVCYGASGYPDANTPGSSARGKQFFAGGGTGNGDLAQTVNVSSAASAIDAGGVPFNLSGWLGGYAGQNDRVGMTATFLNAAGSSVGTATVAPVTSTDRGSATKFLQRSATGTLPAGTRSIKVDLGFTWTAGDTTDGYADDVSLTVGANVPTAPLTAPTSSVPGFDHVFVVYMENEDYSGIIGNTSQAPYINSLLSQGTSLSQSYAITHPSDPNYVALAGGGLYGLHDNSIGTTTINAPHVGNSTEAVGKTWKTYVENENGNCDYTSHGYYAPDDVPFAFFQDFKADESPTGYCGQHDQPLTQMTADLRSAATTPNFVWFEPDDCDDMESCGVTAGDTWLKTTLPSIFNSPAWTQQKSLLILTWDEGATKAYGPNYSNRIPTLLLGSQNTVKAGYTSSQRTDQYGLLRTVDKALGLASLTNNDAYAATVNDAWGQTTTNSPTLTTSTPSVANGSSVTFSYSTPPAANSAKNWIGIYKSGDTPGSQASTAWQYTPGTSGSATFTANYGAGTYKVYYFSNDGYTVLAGPISLTLR